MDTPHTFEQRLKELGYSIYFEEKCDHTKDDDNNTFYVQEDLDDGSPKIIKSVELKWAKHVLCTKCLNSYMGILYCGGHYTNTRLYLNDKLDEDNDFTHDDLNPERIIPYSSDIYISVDDQTCGLYEF